MKKEPFRMEPSNLVCPRCSKGGYMYILHGSNVGELDIKCTNCETYFKSSEFYKSKPKRDTNHDRIISKTPEELAELFGSRVCVYDIGGETNGRCLHPYTCEKCWLDWLRQEVTS